MEYGEQLITRAFLHYEIEQRNKEAEQLSKH